jgi:putative phosphoesterase
MKIAVISDVHGNLPALRAVLRHSRRRGAREFWDLGDITGYSPFPEECVRLLQKTIRFSVIGNYDEKVISPRKIKKIRSSSKDPDKIFSFVWSHEHLSVRSRKYLKNLPFARRCVIDGQRFFLTHKMSRKKNVGAVVSGHTHGFMDIMEEGVRYLNPGSVGRSFDGDWRASYAILDTAEAPFTFRNYRVPYDRRSLVSRMKKEKFPPRLIRSVTEGRSLEEL